MYNTGLVKQILQSAEAQRMRGMMTSGFYDRSRIGLWLYEAIGREYDEMAGWAQSMRCVAFPQTCIWSIEIWEWVYGIVPDDTLLLNYRCGRIFSKKLQAPPINPARIEAVLSALTGAPVKITENIALYTFRVDVDESGGVIYDYRAALKMLREIKPSHLSFRYESRIEAGFTVADYCAGAIADLLREYFIEEIEIITGIFGHYAGAIAGLMREHITGDESPIQTNTGSYNAGAAFIAFREYVTEEQRIAETVTTYDSGAVPLAITRIVTAWGQAATP